MPIESSSSRRIDTRIIFDRKTGEIIHIHQTSVLPGGKLPDENELRDSAIDLASRSTGTSGEQMEVISVREEDLRNNTKYKVDVKNKCLVIKSDQTAAEN
ncbi:hypothetical protein BH20ACI4_BH20ACI4_18610 [soil metagenome]